ncbi:MAG: helicase-related protein [Acidimicrobiales bacterium]
MTHGALSASLKDPFISLAIVRHGLQWQRRLSDQRAAFPRWAARLLRAPKFTAARTRRLLQRPPSTWAGEWERLAGVALDDEPVPAAALHGLAHVDLSELRAALAEVPLRSSSNIDQRLARTQEQLSSAIQSVWSASLRHLGERLPLLILDEAHHAKNTNNLARSFESQEALRDAKAVSGSGPLADLFERMLFLTATPFQLGHRELISVLSRFDGARVAPAVKAELRTDLGKLTLVLDTAQAASLRLERAWGRLTSTDLAGLAPDWWDSCPTDAPEGIRTCAARIGEARDAMSGAEELLRPWIIRHTKCKLRTYRSGQQILTPGASSAGLEVTGPAIMPFLLAARAQALVSLHGLRDHRATHAYFAEGLASSFEAFADTRAQRPAVVDDLPDRPNDKLPADVQWYVDKIAAALPATDPGNWSRHPKLKATTDETVNLWRQGDKVLIFCFYRATGRALRSHISRSLLAEIAARGAAILSLDPVDQPAVLAALEQRADTLLRADAAGTRAATERILKICAKVGVSDVDADQMVDVAIRFMRTASFLVRFVDLGARRGADAVGAAFDRADGSGVTLEDRIEAFADLVRGLTEVERSGMWDALRKVQTGSITTVAPDFYDPGEAATRREATLPNVRLANGTVRADFRHRLMRTFNTPFFPEVLIASSVMAEGVDLHLDCRHVIHHDLDWNPSVLEQRTGRLDRLGSKAERHGSTIVVYEPYMSGAQDEKMYRVVKDRERWFSVVMGEQLDTSEWATDHTAERIPLPDNLLQTLTVDLSVGATTSPR